MGALARLIIGQHGACPSFSASLAGFSATIAEDGSEAWDQRDLTDEHDIVSLLNSFEDCLADHADNSFVKAVFDALTAGTRPAALWRRVLAAGARNYLVAERLFPLDQTFAQCLTKDLEQPLAQLIAARQAERPAKERARLEAAITALAPGCPDDGSPEWARADHRYRRLLAACDPTAAVSPDMAADSTSSGPPPRVAGSSAPAGRYCESTDIYGIVLCTDADRAVWPLAEPVKQFADAHLNDVPAPSEIEPCLRAIERLRDALSSQSPSQGLREFAESALASAAEVVTRRATDIQAEALTVARTLLLDLRSHRLPAPTRDQEPAGAITIPPGPRGDVARGLLQLARLPGYYDQEILTAIETLTDDRVPWVRYCVARGLPLMRHADPERMWDLLGRIAQRDSSDRVLGGVVRAAWALRNYADSAVDVRRRVAARVTPTGQRDSALEACTEAAGLFWVLDGLPAANAILEQLTDLQAYGSDALIALLHEIRSARALTLDDDAIRDRALRLCQRLTDVGFAATGNLEAVGLHPAEDEQTQIGAGIRLLDAVAAQLDYASGAFDARQGGAEAAAPAPARSGSSRSPTG